MKSLLRSFLERLGFKPATAVHEAALLTDEDMWGDLGGAEFMVPSFRRLPDPVKKGDSPK